MSKISESTRNKIKDQILRCITLESKTARVISLEINRSWNLTNKLLIKIESENPNITVTNVGPIKAYAIRKNMSPMQETA